MTEENKIRKEIGMLIRESRKLRKEIRELEHERWIHKKYLKNEKQALPLSCVGIFFLAIAFTSYGIFKHTSIFIAGALIATGIVIYHTKYKQNQEIQIKIKEINNKIEKLEERNTQVERDCWYNWSIIENKENRSLLKAMKDNENFKTRYLISTIKNPDDLLEDA